MKEINYEELDELCVPLVRFFNSVGLETISSCQGHEESRMQNPFWVMFSAGVTDKQIKDFLLDFPQEHTPFAGRFVKWLRKINGELVYNWEYLSEQGTVFENQEIAKIDMETMIQKVNGDIT